MRLVDSAQKERERILANNMQQHGAINHIVIQLARVAQALTDNLNKFAKEQQTTENIDLRLFSDMVVDTMRQKIDEIDHRTKIPTESVDNPVDKALN